MTKKIIQGAGGGGGKGRGGSAGRVAQEAPDSLRSIAYAQVLDLVAEGEIEGLANGLQSVYFDETPLQNPNNTFNFSGATVFQTTGTQAQSYIPGTTAVENEIGVGVEVNAATPIVRQISNQDIDAVRVRVSLPQLTSQNVSNGDLNGTTVQYAIDVQSNGGGYVTQATETITGKTTSKYERSTRISLTGSAPWDIRVRRITPDSTSAALQNKTFWESYTEIIDGKFRYPNSAIIAVRIDSSQFQNIPRRSYDLKLLRVKIPSNYNPTTRAYTGIWDGNFNVAWTDNPAWCFYDLLTNSRYGLGEFIPESQVDKWTLYAIGRYCDELVDNGFGGREPRYTCNIYLQSREEAFNVVNNMASIFRGMPYWSSGSITLGFDAPADPVYQFTNSNVIDGIFNYSGSSIKARHTVALVTWNDPDDFYRQKVEYVEDAEGISRYGIVQTEVVAVGCTSRGQANRVGRWILFTEQSETEVVNFKTGLEGYTVRPSQIVQIADEMRAGVRRGGRIVSATLNSVVLDQDVSAVTGIVGGSLSVILPNGTLETRTISTATGTTVTTATNFTALAQSGAVWMVQTQGVSAQTFKIISAVETEDGVEVTALAHNPQKYGAVEQNLILQPRQISALSITPNSPSGLAASETLYEESADIRVLVTLSWEPVFGASEYQVSYRVDENNYVVLPNTSATSIEIRNAIEGVYTFKVFALNTINKKSLPTELTQEIYGKTLPPADVQNFSVNIIGTEAYMTWSPVPDLDLSHYVIRHSRLTTGATFANSIDLVEKVPRPGVFAIAPAMTGTYFIKAVDKSGFESVNAAESVALINDISGLNVVETLIEQPTFSGLKEEVEVVDGKLVLDTAADFDDIGGLFDDVEGLFDGAGGDVSTLGTYDFSQVVDLGNVYTSRVTAFLEFIRVDYVNTFDAAEGLFDSRLGDFDGDPNQFDDTTVELWISKTNDDPGSSPVNWTDYRKFVVGDYTARAFRFRALLISRDATASPSVSRLEVEVDMPDRVAAGDDIASGTDAGGKVVNFVPAFKATPAIGIAAQNLQQGDFYTITAKSPTSFTIKFMNSSGTAVNRTFDYLAKGYGELVS